MTPSEAPGKIYELLKKRRERKRERERERAVWCPYGRTISFWCLAPQLGRLEGREPRLDRLEADDRSYHGRQIRKR